MIAIIPARGGSKRFPNKNIHLLAGKPLIAYSIEFALLCPLISKVCVSTDNFEIAEISKSFGAEVLDRPAWLAEDETPTSSVIAFHANQLDSLNILPNWIVLLQPTNPFRQNNLIENAFEKMIRHNRESLVTFSALNKKFGMITNDTFYPENYSFGQRMQDIVPRFFENGLIYIMSAKLAKEGDIFGSNPYPYILDGIETLVDIDAPEDMLLAEFVLKKLALSK